MFSIGPASSRSTLTPRSASTLVAVPPPAPDPITTTSWTAVPVATCAMCGPLLLRLVGPSASALPTSHARFGEPRCSWSPALVRDHRTRAPPLAASLAISLHHFNLRVVYPPLDEQEDCHAIAPHPPGLSRARRVFRRPVVDGDAAGETRGARPDVRVAELLADAADALARLRPPRRQAGLRRRRRQPEPREGGRRRGHTRVSLPI